MFGDIFHVFVCVFRLMKKKTEKKKPEFCFFLDSDQEWIIVVGIVVVHKHIHTKKVNHFFLSCPTLVTYYHLNDFCVCMCFIRVRIFCVGFNGGFFLFPSLSLSISSCLPFIIINNNNNNYNQNKKIRTEMSICQQIFFFAFC